MFKHFGTFVQGRWGDAVWEEVLEAADLQTEGPFLGPADYPEGDLLALFKTTLRKIEEPLPKVLRAFGRHLLPKFAEDMPLALEDRSEVKDFLMSVDGFVHVEIQRLHPATKPPKLVCEDLGHNELKVHYHSERQFCQLLHGMMEGAADLFGSTVNCEETACTQQGDSHCTFHIRVSEGVA